MPLSSAPDARSSRWGAPVSELSAELVRRLAAVRMVAFDFDGVMTDNRVFVDETGRESVVCSRFEGFGLERLQRLGVALCIISTEHNPVVAMRAAKLKLPVEHGVADKVAMLTGFAAKFGVPMGTTAFVGNDVNDIPALNAAGVAIVVADAFPAMFAHADYVTHRPGGSGAVREVCDLIAEIQEAAPGSAQEDELVLVRTE